MKRHVNTTVLGFLGLILFAVGGLLTPSSATTFPRMLSVVRTNPANDQQQDDSSCDLADDDNVDDDSFQAQAHDAFAVIPQASIPLPRSSRYVDDSVSSPDRTSLDVARIPNRAPPLANHSA